MNKLNTALTIGAIAAATALPSTANVIYTFSANGVTESVSQQASARFDFADAQNLTVTLTNNVDPTQFVLSILSGLEFSFTQAPASLTLTGVNAPQVIDCSNVAGSSCPAATSFPSSFGWGVDQEASGFALAAGYGGGTFSYTPYNIVNQHYIAPGSGGLSDPANNPLLVGPVTFTFALSGLTYIPEVASATFLFGDPIRLAAVTVPEPGSLALLGIGFLSAVVILRFRRRKDDPRG